MPKIAFAKSSWRDQTQGWPDPFKYRLPPAKRNPTLPSTMTSVLPPQHTPLPYSTRFTRATVGILLNPNTHHQPFSLPSASYPLHSNHHPSTQSLSSSASSEDVNTPSSDNPTPPLALSNSLTLPYVSEDDRVPRPRTGSAPEYVSSPGRRSIRFAPLPVPRRAVCVTEHGEEIPLPAVFDDDDPSIISHSSLRDFPAQPCPSLLLGDTVAAPKQLSAIITSDTSSPRQQSLRPPSNSKSRRTSSPTPSTSTVTPATLSKRFLPSFWHKSDDSRPSGSRDSSSSRDGSPPSFGIPLGHWVSADAANRRGSTSSTNGAPLARAQSASSAPQKPKRLLNGRVYGARKPYTSANAFANVPDKEPEFVEWGHGGMGSVRAGGMWSKVQSDQKLLIGHTEERGRRGTPAAPPTDENDGSGMGWVKKRREERERKKREEQAALEAASKTNVVSASSPVSDATPSPTSSELSADHKVLTVTLSQPTPENHDEDDSEDEDETKDDSLDDGSSSTEQEDDDDAEVSCLVPFPQPYRK